MKKMMSGFAVALASVVSFAAASHSEERGKSEDHRPQKILGFQTMYGVDGPFIGHDNAIRGVDGDEAPWVVGSARGSLDTTGHLRIQVRGLVFGDDPRVDPELVGKNDAAEFRGLVSCLTEVGEDTVETKNVETKEIG